MKRVSTVEFRKNIYKHTKELPLAVTAKKKVVFYVVDKLERIVFKEAPPPAPKIEKPKEVKIKPVLQEKILPENIPVLCPRHKRPRIGNSYVCGCPVQ